MQFGRSPPPLHLAVTHTLSTPDDIRGAPDVWHAAFMTSADFSRLDPTKLPARLARVHRDTSPGDSSLVQLPTPAIMERERLDDVLEGAGFAISRRQVHRRTRLVRQWTLPDTVAPDMTVLICGLNPSPGAADTGIGFARPGNRFWPAAIASGLVTIDRDPDHALHHHGVGMTDIVKRTTRRAEELSPDEFRHGFARIERLVRWLRPEVMCFVGLTGWRQIRDRRAGGGWQSEPLGSTRVYLMPSTSGLNASSQLPDFVNHLRNLTDS